MLTELVFWLFAQFIVNFVGIVLWTNILSTKWITCPYCYGLGKTISKSVGLYITCDLCEGRKRVRVPRDLDKSRIS